MAENLTREQFRIALADAVVGVLNVYREVDAMVRELGTVLGDGSPRFAPIVKRLVPGVGRKNPDARYLREYIAAVYAPVDAMEEEDPDEDDEEDGEGDEEEGEGEGGSDEEEGAVARSAKQPLTIKAGSGIIVARATIYDRATYDRATPAFEPNLVVAALTRCRIDVDVAPGTPFKVARWRFKRILRALDRHRWVAGKPLDTNVPAQIVGGPKTKHKLTFDLPNPLKPLPLFEVTPEQLRAIAAIVRKEWSAASSG
jgi:hypothetical protein